MQRLVRNEITLKGCHLVFIERRGIRPTPHIPDIIHGEKFFFIAVFVKISSTDQLVDLVHQFLTPIFLSSDIDTLETAILVQRHGSMIQKVRITYQIHAAIGKQTTHVLFQLFTIHERIVQLIYQFFFFIRQAIRIFRIYCREVRITHLVLLTFINKNTALKIDLLQQLPVLHAKFRTAVDYIRFQFKLNNRNRLVHLRDEPQSLFVISRIRKVHFRSENSTRIIGISIHGKCSQGKKIDAVSVFERT